MATYKVNFYMVEPIDGQEPDITVNWKSDEIMEVVRDCEKIVVWKNFYRAVIYSSVCPKYVLKVISNYYYRYDFLRDAQTALKMLDGD